jgi:endoglucanase
VLRSRALRRLAIAAGIAVAALLAGCATSSSSGHPDPPAGLHVSGNRILDKFGRPIEFQGVNRSGSEYSCIQGAGIFDGPSDPASVAAMASWHINIVRIPLNEDCWLGINGVKPQYSGATYRRAIVNYVNLLHRNGMYAEVSLMWAAPGSARATYQSNGPDEDHSPAVWEGMAAAFKNDPNVILAPWGETTVDWACFVRGCNDGATFSSADGPFDGDGGCGSDCDFYTTAGMQQAVNVMREHGYKGPIAIPCIAYANVCADPTTGGTGYGNGSWLTDRPTDPDHQLVAEMHVYGGNVCDTTTCLNLTILPILKAGFPVIFGETGESYDASDCGTSHISNIVDWADSHRVGYEAWTWDTWRNCGALIRNYAGAPYGPYGAWIKAHYTRRKPRLLSSRR